VIISDDSKKINYEVEILSLLNKSSLKAIYVRNSRTQGVGGNSNNALLKTSGEIVHVIHLDDQLYDERTYELVEETFASDLTSDWIFFAGSINSQIYVPTNNAFAELGQNSFGGPSGLFVRSKAKLLYDENLRMYIDTDLVSRLKHEHPSGKFSEIPVVKYGVGPWQIQRNTTNQQLLAELEILVNKTYVTDELIRRSRWALKGSNNQRNLSRALYNQGIISGFDHSLRIFKATIEEKILIIRFHLLRKQG
jgi:glycosyltransferase involved in cell wall biosynthesis